jgi:hypothetical protein
VLVNKTNKVKKVFLKEVFNAKRENPYPEKIVRRKRKTRNKRE